MYLQGNHISNRKKKETKRNERQENSKVKTQNIIVSLQGRKL